jgi:hypothetical protein
VLARTTADDVVADRCLQETVASVREASKSVGVSGGCGELSSTGV